jgi:3-oxoacyl-[acyl-carrier protein] reductase
LSLADLLGLDGRVVVVAGAGGDGIGTGVCRLLAQAGASVVGLDNRPAALDAFRAATAGTAGAHLAIEADVRDPSDTSAAVERAMQQGPLHGLVHVAGGMRPAQWAPLLETDPAVWDEVIELNLRSALITSQAVARRLPPAGGSMVMIASITGLSAMPFAAAYAAAKAGLMALTRTAALEWGPKSIRVNAVAAGTVSTAKTRARSPDGAADPAERTAVPLGRRGTPDDVAGAVVFLLSDLAGWITGQVLPVDGGSSIRPSFLGADDLPVFVHDAELRARLLAKRTFD